jgi:PPOX class probable F420-dependent enzyme
VDRDEALRRLATARVGRLATSDPTGRPHVVPFVFALEGSTLYWAVDDKPKRTPRLRRLTNIAANPRVEAVVDEYDDDWSRLWWVRASGIARVLPAGEATDRARDALAGKYDQYRERPPGGPFVAIDIDRVTGWSASP